jgi:hypothetical protein
LADLASATYVSRGWINNVEAGRRWPVRSWVEQAERELNAVGTLLPEWDKIERRRATTSEVSALLAKSVRESELLLASQPDAVDLDRIQQFAANLGVAYLSNPAQPMLRQAMMLRDELTRRLRVADHAGDDELRAWARGTQALIARFDQNYERSREYIMDGLRYAGAGISEVRLLCGAAQTAANLGDVDGELAQIAAASKARERSHPDTVEGLFGFSPAKQAHYSGSALMWLSDKRP